MTAFNVNNGTQAFDATAAMVAEDINGAGITGLTASVSGGQVALSLADGADLTLTGTDLVLTAIGFASTNRTSTNGDAAIADVQTSVAEH